MKRLFLIVLVLVSAQLHAQSYDEGLSQATGKLAASIAGREGQIATVLDLNGLDGATTQLGKLVAQDVFDQLVGNAPTVMWIDLSRRDFIIQENKLAADRLMDPVTQKQLGKLLGLSMVITGTVTELGNSARIQLRAVEIETARVLASASTTVVLPEALARLNDRLSTSRSEQPHVGSAMQTEPIQLDIERVDLLRSARDPDQFFTWATTFSITNRSGADVWVIATGLSLGSCLYRLETYLAERLNPFNGIEYTDSLNTRLNHSQRLPYYTPLPSGGRLLVTVRDRCRKESLPSFASGETSLVLQLAVDFGDRLERRSLSSSRVRITTPFN